MSTTYAQKKATAQKKDAPTASSVLDNSSQNEGLQRKADMANKVTQQNPSNMNSNNINSAIQKKKTELARRGKKLGGAYKRVDEHGHNWTTLNIHDYMKQHGLVFLKGHWAEENGSKTIYYLSDFSIIIVDNEGGYWRHEDAHKKNSYFNESHIKDDNNAHTHFWMSPEAKSNVTAAVQLKSNVSCSKSVIQQEKNNTGLPDNLKSGIESLSGFSMDDVRVHYNSSKPATVQALAYTQGTDIHVAPGQEKHLPHEAWHVAQQMAGRVSPTTNINGMPVNDNAELEHEADIMGERAVKQRTEKNSFVNNTKNTNIKGVQRKNILQKKCYLGKRNLLLGFSGSLGSSKTSRYEGNAQSFSDSSTPSLLLGSSSSSLPTIGLDASSRISTKSEIGSKGTTSKVNNTQSDISKPEIRKRKTFINAKELNKRKSKEKKGKGREAHMFGYNANSETLAKNRFSFLDIGFYHAHFWFDHRYRLPYSAGDLMGNNIGFGGILYSDESGFSNYDLIGPISATPDDVIKKKQPQKGNEQQGTKKQGTEEQGELNDYHIVAAMKSLTWKGGYNALTHNCQHWANNVITTANAIKDNSDNSDKYEEAKKDRQDFQNESKEKK